MVLTLPTPGGNLNVWGGKLNDWLEAQHSGVFNVLLYGAVGDGVTDDTDAIQDAIDAAGAFYIATGMRATVYFPPGTYLVSLQSTVSLSSAKYRLLVKYDHITLQGAGKRQSIIKSTDNYANGHSTIAVWGQAKASPTMDTATIANYDFNFNPTGVFTYYDLDAGTPPTYGEYTCDLDDSADNVNFAAGRIVYLRTGQTIDGGGSHGQPDAEMNRVTDVSGASLPLERPLLKNYEPEFFTDNTEVGPTTISSTAYPAIYGIADVHDAVIDGFAALDLHFECHAADGGNCISTSQVMDPYIRCTANTTNMGLQGDGSHRGLVIDNPDVTQNPTSEEGSWMSCDKGCGDTTVIGGRVRNPSNDYLVFFHVNEGAANVIVSNFEIINPYVPASPNSVFSHGGRGYRQTLQGFKAIGGSDAPLVKFADVDGAVIDGCTLPRSGATAGMESLSIGAAGVASNDVVIGSNDYGHGVITLHHNNATKTPPRVQPTILQAWVKYTDSTVVVGYLPTYARVLQRRIKRNTVFNGTTPTVSLGKVGSPTLLLGNQDMTTVDSFLDDFLDDVNPGYEVIATVTTSGASQGRALVLIEYVNGLVPS